MKKTGRLLWIVTGLLWLSMACNQSAETNEKVSVENRMAKARAGKAQKQAQKAAGIWVEREPATPSDYRSPVDKVLKGPNGEVVHTGERGAKFYINKNGNRTYLSSNR